MERAADWGGVGYILYTENSMIKGFEAERVREELGAYEERKHFCVRRQVTQAKLTTVEVRILLLCVQESHGRILSKKGCKVLCIKKKKIDSSSIEQRSSMEREM